MPRVIFDLDHAAAGALVGSGARRWRAHLRWGREGRGVDLTNVRPPKNCGG
jgi:hypothetical protein